MHLHLPPQILQLHHPRFQIHQQRRPQLVLRPRHLILPQGMYPALERELMEFAADDVDHGAHLTRAARGRDAEEARVRVGVVEGLAGLEPAVLVEDIGVEARIHAFAGTASGKGATAAEEGLERGEGVDVRGSDSGGFEGDVDVGEAGEGDVGGGRDWREGKEAGGVVSGKPEVGIGREEWRGGDGSVGGSGSREILEEGNFREEF